MPGYYDRDGNPISVEHWCKLLNDMDYKVVARFDCGDGDYVSTVYLGLDHSYGLGKDVPPIIFETMAFSGGDDVFSDRYSTVQQALAGHDEIVRQFLEWRRERHEGRTKT